MLDAATRLRFWVKVDRSVGPEACWLWQAGKLISGYGRFKYKGKTRYAHRFSYELYYGPIPEGMEVDHVKARGCTSTSCVNPAHLEAVTPRENVLRSANICSQNAHKTHCPKGHDLSGDINMLPDGRRSCRICQRESWKQFARRKRANLRQMQRVA